jgi:hypothetical protein
MRVLRSLAPGVTVCLVLAGCGATHSTKPANTAATAAPVANTAIPPQQIQEYMDYALQFYSWVDTTTPGNGTTTCSVRSTSPSCVTLRKQVVRRLMEERIVTEFAAQHSIRLSSADRSRVDREMKRLQSPHSGTRRLFGANRVSPHFMRGVLQTQLLVRRVEAAVVGKAALVGPSFRLRKFVFGGDQRGYKSATDLATGGINGAAGPSPPIHWVAAYRLPAQLRSLAGLARKGDYVGPSPQGGSYVVYQILGHGVHRYGLPAREETEARSFRAWLATRMSQTQPKCLQGGAKSVPCSALYH